MTRRENPAAFEVIGMFQEYFERHPLAELLTENLPLQAPKAEEKKMWNRILPLHREEILKAAEEYRQRPYPMRTASGFLAFTGDGSRKADEDPYFFRRRKLCISALACCLGEVRYLQDAVDGIWCICEESSWVVSAHNVNPIPGAPAPRDYRLPDTEKPYVDLFCAQTGMILSLIRHMLSEKLDAVSPEITRRITREIRRRILEPFRDHDEFWWMGVKRKDLNNWTPWIFSNVMICICLEMTDKKEKAALLERGCLMLDRWLDTVPPDGGCDEGAGYWNMAGGALLDCLEQLEQVTGGRVSFRDDEKIRNMMTFPRKAEIGGGWFMNFADCDARPLLSAERLLTAGEMWGDEGLKNLSRRLIRSSGRETREGTWVPSALAELSDVPHFTRLLKVLFRTFPAAEPAGEAAGDTWLPDLQVRVVRRGELVLCCKGGHNGENHNHNDVGSFMLFAAGEPEIVDAGNMIYTAVTFSPQRYTLWNVRSLWHNVPLIGGCEQAPGTEYAAREVECLENGLSLEMAGAYPKEAGAESLRRRMELTEEGLRVQDHIALKEAASVTWTLLLRCKPEIGAEEIRLKHTALRIPRGLSPALEEKPVTDARMGKNFPGTLYRLTLTAQNLREGAFVFEFLRK